MAAGPRSRTPHPVRIAALAVAGSAAGFGLGPYLATRAIQAGITAEVSGLIRVLVLFLALIPYGPEAVKSRGMFRLCLLGGAGTMLGYYTFLRAIAAGVGPAATIVYYTYPGLVLVLSAAVSTRRLRLRDALLAGLILAGVLVSIGSSTIAPGAAAVLALSVAAPLSWAANLILLSGPLAPMRVLPKLFGQMAGGVVVLTPLVVFTSGPGLMPFTREALVAATMQSIIGLALPAALIAWAAPRTGARPAGLIGSLEFVVAMVAAWLLLGEPLLAGQAIGVTMVSGAVVGAAISADTARPIPIADRREGQSRPPSPIQRRNTP